jgi:hypothetical protein
MAIGSSVLPSGASATGFPNRVTWCHARPGAAGFGFATKPNRRKRSSCQTTKKRFMVKVLISDSPFFATSTNLNNDAAILTFASVCNGILIF